MKRLFVMLSFIFMISTGCSIEVEKHTGTTSDSASNSAILIINDAEYLSFGTKNQDEYTRGEEIGVVETRVPPGVLPKENFASNYLDEGIIIYSVKEDDDVFLVKTNEEGVYEVFERSR